MNHGAWRSLLVVFVLFFAWAAAPAQAQAVDGPVFLVIALDNADGTGTFTIDGIKANGKDAGSNTIIVKIGTLSSGGEIGGANDTTFTSEPPADGVPVPKISGVYLDPTTLEGNESTVFGTFEVQPLGGGDLEPHMLTTRSESSDFTIDPVIQAAVFAAASALEAAVAEDPFMKTGEIADIVFQELPNNSGYELADVAAALFGTDETLLGPNSNPPTASGTVECDGELFPHEEGAALYEFKIALKATKDSKGNNSKFADYDLAKLIKNVDVVVKESSVNPDKNGTMPVAIYSGPGFDAADVDTGTGKVLLYVVGGTTTGVSPSSTSLSDQNDDGISDLVCHFSVPDLVKFAGLSSSTTKLKLTGALTDGVTEIQDLDISINMLQK